MSQAMCTVPCMWVPRSADDIIAVLPSFTESASVEAKRELPPPRKNPELAIDIAAMSTDGGVIIYGIEEDKAAGTFSASPIPLAGTHERVAQVAAGAIGGSPVIEVIPLPYGPEGSGFLVVVVSASPLAPHMVMLKGEQRFYGRTAAGNDALGQGEVDRLYERRRRAEFDREALLNATVAASPYPASEDGVLHVVTRAVLGDGDIRERWSPPGDQLGWANVLLSAATDLKRHVESVQSLSDLASMAFCQPTMDGIEIRQIEDETQATSYAMTLVITDEGVVRLHVCRAALVRRSPSGERVRGINDGALVQLAAQTLFVAGSVYEAAGYHGPVDIGYHLAGAAGAPSTAWGNLIPRPEAIRPVPDEAPGTVLRTQASGLGPAEYRRTTRLMFERLLRVIRPQAAPDPLGV
jgi:hypothetical protein